MAPLDTAPGEYTVTERAELLRRAADMLERAERHERWDCSARDYVDQAADMLRRAGLPELADECADEFGIDAAAILKEIDAECPAVICGDSSLVECPVLPEGGGSIPTSPLQLRKSDWIVACADQDIAYRLVAAEHYARGASNTATYLHGLYPAGWHWYSQCVGVAWWIPPTRSAAEAWAGGAWKGVLALSRLAIEPGVPKNACSYLLSRSVRLIDRRRWHTFVTYADSWRGHTGAIYRACGWEYAGETAPEAVYTLNGRMLARKAGGSTRTHRQMLALGCAFEGRHAKSRFVLRSAG